MAILKIGLTGGIGSGKSTVAHAFQVLGAPVYFADEEAKRIMQEDPELKTSLVELFGAQTFRDQQLDRAYLASIVFNDPDKLAQLNALVHPATISAAEKWMQKQSFPYAIKEAALIFESGAQEQLDKVIGVNAPMHVRIHRVMKRDQCTREEVLARMQKQIDEEIKMKLCDFVITNNDVELVLPQVLKIHETLLANAART